VKIVVLASGGIDSSLIMNTFKNDGHEVLPLYINYGQLAKEKEWSALSKVCDILSLTPFKMDIEGFGKLPSGLTNPSLDIHKDAFLPTRNLTLITLGSAYAYSKESSVVSIGLLANPIFPDQTRDFVDKAEISISAALGKQITILTPLIGLDKRDVLRLAAKYGLPNVTYYCHSGNDLPCGKCISCLERLAAERALNIA
jgi:7-cyano-7-deazaguanine synthase